MLSAVDLRLIVGEMIEQAIGPLQRRIAELERRPAAPAAIAAPAPVATRDPVPAAPQAPRLAVATVSIAQTPAVPAVVSGAQVTYAAAMVMPADHAPRTIVVAQQQAPPAPMFDLAAIERDIPIDVDFGPFDGLRRRRRMVFLFVLSLLVVFGGLFALLADSYSHTHK
jgi:hypothetical protein